MKYSYNWLKELSGTEQSPKDLAQMIMLKGFEPEAVDFLADKFENFVVGEIVALEKHPKADRLQVAKVAIAAENDLCIVCGAQNIKVGDKVPVALSGALVPNGKFKIQKNIIRGVTSEGMLCAEDELGVGKDHKGIYILSPEAKTGEPLKDFLVLDKAIFDFKILPNRAHDCLSHEGLAREISAMEGRRYETNEVETKTAKGQYLEVSIQEAKLCPRYMGAILRNITVGSSPQWMQARLIASGMEPINNVVDITNYVMLEVGSPLHAFDLRKIQLKDELEVEIFLCARKAKPGEKIELLDGKILTLDCEDLVIADQEKPLALAGIKGGKDSGVSEHTGEIVLEAANFSAVSIRRSRQRHGLTSESQMRFEKKISPELTERAFFRAITLLKQYAGAEILEIKDVYLQKQETQVVELEIASVEKLLGYAVETKTIKTILDNLGFILKEESSSQLSFEIPYWRLDIEGQEDFIEEVGRLIGYEKIKEKALNLPVALPKENVSRQLEWRIKDILIGLGCDETPLYSFYSQADAERIAHQKQHLTLENSLTPECTQMRRTLLPNLIKAVERNIKYFNQFTLFDLGRVYSFEKGEVFQELKIGLAHFNDKISAEEGFYELKGKLTVLLEALLLEKVDFKPFEQAFGFFHPLRSAEIKVNGKSVGVIGDASLEVLRDYGIKKPVSVCELDFPSLLQMSLQIKRKYQPLRKFPLMERDIAFFVESNQQVSSLEKIIKNAGGPLLEKIEFFDAYLDKKSNKKSLAFHLVFGSQERTLNSQEVDLAVSKIMIKLNKNGAEIRR